MAISLRSSETINLYMNVFTTGCGGDSALRHAPS